MSVVQSTRTFAEHTQVRGWAREAGSGTQQPQRHRQYNDTDNTNHNIIIVDIDHINYSRPLFVSIFHVPHQNIKYSVVYFKFTNDRIRYKELGYAQCRIIHAWRAVRQPLGAPAT